MRSVQFERTGIPEDVLGIREVDQLEPTPGKVRVQVLVSNINPSDLLFIKGQYGIVPDLPSAAGIEGIGVVDAGGESTSLQPGQKVVFTSQGVWQEYISIPEFKLIPVPNDTPDEIGCQIMVNPLTARRMLELSGLESGQWLLLTAGNSAVGKFASQLCRLKGINAISTVRHQDISEHLRHLGSKAVINSEQENLVQRTRELTHFKGVDAVFDAVGGRLGSEALRCLRSDGEMIIYGALDKEPLQISSGQMIFHKWRINSFWRTPWMDSLDTQARIEVVHPLLELFAENKLKADIEAIYPMEDVIEAVKHVQTAGRKGKILLKIAS